MFSGVYISYSICIIDILINLAPLTGCMQREGAEEGRESSCTGIPVGSAAQLQIVATSPTGQAFAQPSGEPKKEPSPQPVRALTVSVASLSAQWRYLTAHLGALRIGPHVYERALSKLEGTSEARP
jgi:hypothetical protein